MGYLKHFLPCTGDCGCKTGPCDPCCTTPVITSAASATGRVGQFFFYQITADNSPTSFNFSGDGFYPGLTFNPATGVLSGVPTAPFGAENVIQATNACGTDTQDFDLYIRNGCCDACPFPPNIGFDSGFSGTGGPSGGFCLDGGGCGPIESHLINFTYQVFGDTFTHSAGFRAYIDGVLAYDSGVVGEGLYAVAFFVPDGAMLIQYEVYNSTATAGWYIQFDCA